MIGALWVALVVLLVAVVVLEDASRWPRELDGDLEPAAGGRGDLEQRGDLTRGGAGAGRLP